ncbi:MAG: hypothetical protein ISEC1_P0822 [Thiomicrorhabdus sp.]|nr:MAG: hypothetical protein ISEC1_P0822 [Thiomicrorhabdus sp.]
MPNKLNSFAFFVLAYNHEKYIIEHLESIKHLIGSYGSEIRFQLIVNDDCSRDRTTSLIDLWLLDNRNLFFDVVRIYNDNNVGTCLSVRNGLRELKAEHCKITAGDDVYSCEDLFKAVSLYGLNDILSGVPLGILNGELKKNNVDVFNIIASDIVYKNSALMDRLKRISLINAPSIIYKAEYLQDRSVLDFMTEYDVVEDLPIQIAIAESNKQARFYLDDVVYVYYRRTEGSTFIIASERFNKDQSSIFNYLISHESSFFNKLILKNRLMCFLSKSKLVKRFLNIALWVYASKVIINFPYILSRFYSFDVEITEHQKHLNVIQNKSKNFYSQNRLDDFV